MACPCSAMTHHGKIWKHSFRSLATPSSESFIITFINLVQAGMQRQVRCPIAKEILIITFQLKCNILASLPTNYVNSEQMVENWNPAGHSKPSSSRLLNTEAQRVTVLRCNCPIYAINQLLFSRNKACALSAPSQNRGLFASILFSEQQGERHILICPYVSCEGQPGAAVSPQSADLEASSAPPRCCATQVWLRPVSVECLGGHSHYIRRRYHWGSVKIN